MEQISCFEIGEVTIRLHTPEPLTAEPFFLPYCTEYRETGLDCFLKQVPALPRPPEGARLLFDDGMHRIWWTPAGPMQCFYIPYFGAPGPEQREPDAVQWLDRRPLTLEYRPQAAHYFATACGCFNALKIERLLIGAGRGILHASYIQWEETGIAFTAPSGTGKSTQAGLWERYAGAETVNGDRMVFGLREGRMCGFGLPIAGSSKVFLNRTLPLRAVVLLEQGPENVVRRAGTREALAFLLRQVTVNRWDPDYMGRITALLGALLAQVPVYRLACRPDQEAVECLKNALLT